MQLFLPDHLSDFDSLECRCGGGKRFETKHRARSSFDKPVILLDDVVQVFGSDCSDLGGTSKAFEDLVDRLDAGSIGPTFVDDDPQRNAIV